MEQSVGAVDQGAAARDAASRNQAALRAMAAGDLVSAEAALLEAVSLDKSSLSAWLNLAAVRRQRQDLDGAFNAIREVLTLDARNFPALLMSATMLEKEGRAVPAALAYGAALANAPPDERLDAPTLKAVERGRVVHSAYTRQLNEHIRARVADAEGQVHVGRASPHQRVHRYDAAHPQALSAGALGVLLPGSAGDRVLRAQRIPLARRARSRHCSDRAGARRHHP